MCVAPFVAASRSPVKAGLPVKNGSISTTFPPNSRRKFEWPKNVIFIGAAPDYVRGEVSGSWRPEQRFHARIGLALPGRHGPSRVMASMLGQNEFTLNLGQHRHLCFAA